MKLERPSPTQRKNNYKWHRFPAPFISRSTYHTTTPFHHKNSKYPNPVSPQPTQIHEAVQLVPLPFPAHIFRTHLSELLTPSPIWFQLLCSRYSFSYTPNKCPSARIVLTIHTTPYTIVRITRPPSARAGRAS